MASKLWEKNTEVNQEIEKFTVGRDRELDLYLARYDVLGSMAHITMLESIGLLGKDEQPVLLEELRRIHADIEAGRFIIEEGVEDVHSQVELLLTRKLGDVGKKIHSGRSRNDQVLVDLKLFTRAQLQDIAEEVRVLFEELQAQSELQRGAHAGIHPPSGGHAFQFRTMVRGLRGKSGGRPAFPSGRLQDDQPQPARFCRRLRFIIPPTVR